MSRRNLADRISAADELLSSGYSPSEATHEASARFGVGLRQAQKYVERALDSWAQEEQDLRRTWAWNEAVVLIILAEDAR